MSFQPEPCPEDFSHFVQCISMNVTPVPLCMGSIYPSTEDRLFVGIPVFLLSCASILLNTTLLRILLIKRSFLEPNFRRHIISIIISSIGYILVNYYCFLPIVLFGVVISDPWLIILASPNSSFFQAIQFSNLAIAIDRFLMFFTPHAHQSMTSSYRTRYILLLLPWFFSTFIVIHSSSIGYYKRVNPYTLKYTYECSSGGLYEPILFAFGFLWPSVMFFLYFSIFINVMVKKSSLSRTKPSDLLFLVQLSIISLLQLFSSLFFNFAPQVMGSSRWTALFMTFFSTLNSMNNPIVMIIFQKRIRHAFCTMAKGVFIHTHQIRDISMITKMITTERSRKFTAPVDYHH